jgi:two-component system alkaline phosphatase synthesis response regulator PhoP
MIYLTPKEFDLLVLLASQPGKIFTRQKIMNLVWGYRNDSYLHAVTWHVSQLQAKLEPDFAQPIYPKAFWSS